MVRYNSFPFIWLCIYFSMSSKVVRIFYLSKFEIQLHAEHWWKLQLVSMETPLKGLRNMFDCGSITQLVNDYWRITWISCFIIRTHILEELWKHNTCWFDLIYTEVYCTREVYHRHNCHIMPWEDTLGTRVTTCSKYMLLCLWLLDHFTRRL